MTLRKSLLATSILAATLGLTACGGSSNNETTTPDTTTPTNAAPTNITLTASEAGVKENVSVAQEVGTLAATDADSTSFTFTTADERFTIEGTKLSVKEGTVFDFEAGATVEVEVNVNDGENDFKKTLTIDITDTMDYDFLNADTSKSNVYYTGQVARFVQIEELSHFILNASKDELAADSVFEEINKYYKISEYKDKTDNDGKPNGVSLADKDKATTEYDELWGSESLNVVPDNAKQSILTEISSSHKDLYGKIAGNDNSGQFKNWNLDDSFVGWAGLEGADNTPRGFADELFKLLQTTAKNVGTESGKTVQGIEIGSPYITPTGIDLQQLIEKYFYGAVVFSQGTADYLGDSKDGKGLRSAHTDTDVDEKGYTKLEHQWDEGFGYFGAARNYADYTDNEIAGKISENDRASYKGMQDTNADGEIDLTAEFIWGNSSNAAKRDRKVVEVDGKAYQTDLTKEAYTAFFEGRKLLNETAGQALSSDDAAKLKGYAETASVAWEQAIVATVIHYINYVLEYKDGDGVAVGLDAFKEENYTEYQLSKLGKHWGEMKGFAFAMQFNPYSPFVKTEAGQMAFAKLHNLMGNQPVITDADSIDQYKLDLIDARNILRDSYEWKDANGDKLEGAALNALVEAW
ncbi:DUF4856 domain-containing protein [Pseudoalteromonas phenolica]|uniref:DUF4856 domain-containing protein n=1 Tax=Pseudoalteromonas phenolica TaxID=161398 RepID=A0A5R9PZX3_9GAMM|nr:cadherin repeat domain-containing protein [Pseudoalteromonas phenolica]TLX46134.1 DUF4856 domain-containing protein [Pseudoalteromonas phenolica]